MGAMPRIGVKRENVRKLSVSVSEDSVDWITTQVESQKYRNISHCIESLIIAAKKANETS
jgi:Arc/MetJ-type ribon-helix-helix transcriptional regulator